MQPLTAPPLIQTHKKENNQNKNPLQPQILKRTLSNKEN